jgi:hypothetical protein
LTGKKCLKAVHDPKIDMMINHFNLSKPAEVLFPVLRTPILERKPRMFVERNITARNQSTIAAT